MVEEETLWQDPLLLTDVRSWQISQSHHQAQHTHHPLSSDAQSGLFSFQSFQASSSNQPMEPSTSHLDAVNEILCEEHSWETVTTPKNPTNKTISWKDQISPTDHINGRSPLGYSLTSPDLVICAGSSDIPNNSGNQDNMFGSMELSLDNGMDHVTPHTPNHYESPYGSVDFATSSLPPVISINSGGSDKVSCEIDFLEDKFFTGGEAIQMSSHIGDPEEDFSLYETARCGNFSYKFKHLEPGNYIIELHFSEIVFLNGPPGMRVFDIFIQDEKVVSSMDIYAQVGSNKPLVLSELRAFVDGEGNLSIKFEGVIGKPIVCGVLVWKDSQAEFGSRLFDKDSKVAWTGEHEPQEVDTKLHKELEETKEVLEEVKREYALKSKECREAWKSLRELQNELMRKSMHVGSLAYAIEGQVKEKSKWFLSLRDLTNKVKLLKREHKKLSEEALECKKCFVDVSQMTTIVQSAINQKIALEREHGDLKLKYIEGTKERKELYNKVLELKGNIRVFCRCRPLNAAEIADGASMAIDFESVKDGELTVKANGTSKKVFKFDSVFSPQAGQADIFEDTAPFATSVLDGYNVCIFAYGQTGTGKTFTMEGTEDARGVNYRTLEELFRVIKDRQGLYQYEMSVSVLEVYNEQIRDLLVSGSQPVVNSKRLEIRQVADGIHHVPGLVEAHVNNMNEVWEVLQTGTNSRAVGATNANEHSSRSHCIHCVMIKGENLVTAECTRSKLWLVDLAGSERVAKTDVQGDRLKETQNINRSLSALGDVISALATKSQHIPFRNSKLTHLLQDSLGGDSKTLMFVQISPNENDLSETLCSLNFASRVRGIELGPAKKHLDGSELVKYKQMVEKAKQDMKMKDGYIKKMEETIHSLESKAKTRDVTNKNLQEKIKELESQLLVERKLARQHVDSKIVELQQQKQLQEEQNITLAKPQGTTLQFGNQSRSNELATVPSTKDGMSLIRPLAEKNSVRPLVALPPTDNFLKYNFTEKENKPDTVEQPPMQRRTGRLSVCPNVSNRIPEISAPRRNSLIPMPMGGRLGATPLLPLQPNNLDPVKDVEDDEANDSDLRPCNLRGQKTAMRKINNILRRSLQKKVQIRSPMQQHRRGGGCGGGGGAGMEKVRVSIGSRNRTMQRAMLNNATKGTKEMQMQKEKEKRGWNF